MEKLKLKIDVSSSSRSEYREPSIFNFLELQIYERLERIGSGLVQNHDKNSND